MTLSQSTQLKDFQSRLNERLREAGTTPDLAARLGLMIGGQRWLVAWACATGYAATDELHQAFVPGRGPAVLDVLIDALGAAAACAIAARVWSFADTALAAEDAASR
jgi:hypothetical protein